MTQEEKQLLLVDLCARLPYGVVVKDRNGVHVLTRGNTELGTEYIKPYLRPMSSMTEEETDEFILISDTVLWLGDKRSTCILSLEQMDWLNSHHFDYRGLIEKGLAIEVTEENNPYK